MRRSFVAALVAVAAVAAPVVASAQVVATDLTPIGTTITDTVGVLLPWAIGLIAVVLGASISLGLIKKFGRKAGS